MTTRDPRSRDQPEPTSPGGDVVREPTQSIEFDLIAGVDADAGDAGGAAGAGSDDAQAALAFGTHNRPPSRPVTRIESPGGRGKTPLPPSPRPRRSDDPIACIDTVLGSYRVAELLGKGGMGYVYRAEHVKLGREVALKLLRNDYASRRDAVTRFFQEARTVNRVRHRNIVDVTDFVELDDGTTYIVMELLTGTSLGAWAHGGIDLPRALAVLVQICDGLGAAHQVGVIHRDLKPDNVIVVPTSDGADLVKLLDFGVAKLVNRDDEDVGFQTAAGSVIGTPAYMSPEQAGGMAIDARSDIYSLGAIMYEMFTAQPLFRGRSFGEYVRKHLTEMPVPPHDTPGGAEIDPRLEAVILRCLAKDPEQRFATIIDLREALLHLLGSGFGTNPAGLATAVATSRPLLLPLPAPNATVIAPASMLPGASHVSGAHAAAPMQLPPEPGMSGGHLAPLTLSGEYSLPEPPPPAPTPGWVWFIGGAAAVGLGVSAAIWYAGRGAPVLTTRPAPSSIAAPAPAPAEPSATAPTAAAPTAAAPAVPAVDPVAAAPAPATEPAPAHPALVEVRFDSAPSGSVFAEGRPTELCRTPCSFDIDLGDGGAVDHRVFVVRRAGYVDSPVTVDLAAAQREFQVTLQRAAEPAGDHRPVHRPAKPARPAVDDAQPAPAKPARPTGTTTGKPTAIDPSDTLDPFRKK